MRIPLLNIESLGGGGGVEDNFVIVLFVLLGFINPDNYIGLYVYIYIFNCYLYIRYTFS